MKLRYKYLLSVVSLSALLLLIVGAAGLGPPRGAAVTPSPVISELHPNAIAAGSPAFTLTIGGAYFVKRSVVQWNGEARPTAFVNETVLRAEIPASDAAAEGTAGVTVSNPAFLGEHPGVSNIVALRILPASSF
jgi:hypothetical protein